MGGFDQIFSWMNHQLDLLIGKSIINKQFTFNTNQLDAPTWEKHILCKSAVCCASSRLGRRCSAGFCPQDCLHYSRRGIAVELNLPIWTPSTPGVFMHAGKHRIGCCPSRQPLRTRCLCKYIRWVHVQQSDTKEARSSSNPALWRWLCSPSCLPSLRIEYLNSLMLRTQTKKKVTLPTGRGSIIHDYFFELATTYVLPYMQRIHTWLFNQHFRERKEREREKQRTKNPHHRWAYLAKFDDI